MPATAESVLRINSNPINTLDPQDPNRVNAPIRIIVELFSGLVALNSDLAVVPDIATGWEIQNGVVYTFKLNQDARFHNGDPVTAQDFKWSMERAAKSMAESSLATSYLGDIEDAEQFIVGITRGIRGIQVIDDLTLRIIIDAPNKPYFLTKLASPLTFVLHRKSVEEGGPEWWAENLVGTGPFILGGYAPGELIVLKNNHPYYGEPAGVDTVRINLLRTNVDVPMYQAGEIDVARIGGFNILALPESGDPLASELVIGPEQLVGRYIGFNVNVPPLDDVQFRRALAHALDREFIVKEIFGTLIVPAHAILPPWFLGFDPGPAQLEFNPELARRLLRESAYADPATRPAIVMTSSGGRVTQDLEMVAGMWSDILGVKVDIELIERATLMERIGAGDLPAFVTRWASAYPDPHATLDLYFHSAGTFNNAGYFNPTVDELLELARVEHQDPVHRMELYQEAHRLIVNDVPWLPLWFFRQTYALVKPYPESTEGHGWTA